MTIDLKQAIQEQRIEKAQSLLDTGARDSIISRLLMKQFGCSRATSYRDIDAARGQNMKEDMEDWIENPVPVSFEDRNCLAEMAVELAAHACSERDIKGFSTASKEYERLMKMGGKVYDSHHSSHKS